MIHRSALYGVAAQCAVSTKKSAQILIVSFILTLLLRFFNIKKFLIKIISSVIRGALSR